MLKLTTEEFINKDNLKHNFKYNYDKLLYLNSNLKVIMTCKEHDDFEQFI